MPLAKYVLHQKMKFVLQTYAMETAYNFWNPLAAFLSADYLALPVIKSYNTGLSVADTFPSPLTQIDQLPAVYVAPISSTVERDGWQGATTERAVYEVQVVFTRDGWDRETAIRGGEILLGSALAALNKYLPDPRVITPTVFTPQGFPEIECMIVDCNQLSTTFAPRMISGDPWTMLFRAQIEVIYRYNPEWGMGFVPAAARLPILADNNNSLPDSLSLTLNTIDTLTMIPSSYTETIYSGQTGITFSIGQNEAITGLATDFGQPISGGMAYLFSLSTQPNMRVNTVNTVDGQYTTILTPDIAPQTLESFVYMVNYPQPNGATMQKIWGFSVQLVP